MRKSGGKQIKIRTQTNFDLIKTVNLFRKKSKVSIKKWERRHYLKCWPHVTPVLACAAQNANNCEL